MNPYAPQLGDGDPLQIIAATAGRLDELVRALDEAVIERAPAPGKWNVREILCHLADTELAFAFRLRQALAEPHHVIQPFDQGLWAANYAAYDTQAALRVFTVVRAWNRRLIETVPPDALSKPVRHPERGDMTFRTLIETMAGHDINHLRQMEAITARA